MLDMLHAHCTTGMTYSSTLKYARPYPHPPSDERTRAYESRNAFIDMTSRDTTDKAPLIYANSLNDLPAQITFNLPDQPALV